MSRGGTLASSHEPSEGRPPEGIEGSENRQGKQRRGKREGVNRNNTKNAKSTPREQLIKIREHRSCEDRQGQRDGLATAGSENSIPYACACGSCARPRNSYHGVFACSLEEVQQKETEAFHVTRDKGSAGLGCASEVGNKRRKFRSELRESLRKFEELKRDHRSSSQKTAGHVSGSSHHVPPHPNIQDASGGTRRNSLRSRDYGEYELRQIESSHASVVKSTCESLVRLIAFFATSWLFMLLTLSFSTSSNWVFAVVSVCIAKDLFQLYMERELFWSTETPELLAESWAYEQAVGNVCLVSLTGYGGLFRAVIVVWILDCLLDFTGILFRSCPALKDWLNLNGFTVKQTPIEGPFPRLSSDKPCGGILKSFNFNPDSARKAVFFSQSVRIARYALFYLVTFSPDSWLSKALTMGVALFLRSNFCPRPRVVDEGITMLDISHRQMRLVQSCGHVRIPFFRECLAQQSMLMDHMFRLESSLAFIGLALSLRDRSIITAVCSSLALGISCVRYYFPEGF